MGSDTVCFRSYDKIFGWSQDYPEQGITAVVVEKLSNYASKGIKTMDDLIDYLFYVVKP